MAETTNAPERPLPLIAVALVNALMSVPPMIGLLLGQPLPVELPAWFRPFFIADCAALAAASVGLWLLRRWGFGLLALAYASGIVALIVARQNWTCAAAVQTPLFFVAARQWKSLR